MQIVYRKSPNLLRAAKAIFGEELVKNAWLSTWYEPTNPYHNKRGVQTFFELAEKEIPPDTSIEFEGDSIVIEFSNGKKVLFGSNESGVCCTFEEVMPELDIYTTPDEGE